MAKKIVLFLTLVFVLMFNGFIINAKDSNKEIVYLYSNDKFINETVLNDLKARNISINKINVSKLDNMKYFYHYQALYNLPLDEFAAPIILSGNEYFVIENDSLIDFQDIDNNAKDPLKPLKDSKAKLAIYFYSPSCSGCQEIESTVNDLSTKGIKIVKVDVTEEENNILFINYADSYDYSVRVLFFRLNNPTTPMIFVGSKYYHSADTIKNNLNEIIENSRYPLKNVEFKPVDVTEYEGFIGLLLILLGGLIDGVNPCAMAMLILFLGLLIGTKAKKSTLIGISISYIFGLFISYLVLGFFLIEFLDYLQPYISNLSTFINIFMVVLSLLFFALNLHDYLVAKKKEYQNIKNQLPKGIQKFNKKIIKIFTDSINNKNIVIIYLLSFTLAVIISFTEFLCTGQVYLPILLLISKTGGIFGKIKLILYNVMFVVPLIILAAIAIKARSAMETSNLIREKLYVIKLITSILFLGIAVYYIFILLGVF